FGDRLDDKFAFRRSRRHHRRSDRKKRQHQSEGHPGSERHVMSLRAIRSDMTFSAVRGLRLCGIRRHYPEIAGKVVICVRGRHGEWSMKRPDRENPDAERLTGEATPAALPGDLVRALDWLRSHLAEAVDLELLASVAGVRPRTLESHFRTFLGTTP